MNKTQLKKYVEGLMNAEIKKLDIEYNKKIKTAKIQKVNQIKDVINLRIDYDINPFEALEICDCNLYRWTQAEYKNLFGKEIDKIMCSIFNLEETKEVMLLRKEHNQEESKLREEFNKIIINLSLLNAKQGTEWLERLGFEIPTFKKQTAMISQIDVEFIKKITKGE